MEAKNKPVNKLTFEEALEELETIARDLEQGDLKLDDSIASFERGTELKKLCREKLEEAERKIEILQKGKGPGNEKKVKKKKVKVKEETGEIDEKEDLQGSLL
ncbi:MAG: exodeoxyribonuclease VII small subunit [Spirochaetes bacterium]|nr:exodeoxyribonuclease VII small subunit [Spirochaetota bacterium]